MPDKMDCQRSYGEGLLVVHCAFSVYIYNTVNRLQTISMSFIYELLEIERLDVRFGQLKWNNCVSGQTGGAVIPKQKKSLQ